MNRTMDLNADVGEGYGRWTLGDDASILTSITSANVACGFHAGDPTIIRRTCETAVANRVKVGAHVSYPDMPGFGRRFLDIDPTELADAIVYQLGALDGLARTAGARVAYVKPHGALYHAVLQHEAQALALVEAIRAYDRDLPLMGLPKSAVERCADLHGLRFVVEGFADRAYDADGHLVPRSQPGSVLTDPAEVAKQAVDLVAWRAESLCIHGDTPNAPASAAAARAALEEIGVTVAPFV